MMLTTIFLSAALSAPASGVTDVQFTASAVHVAGEPFVVEQTFTSDGPVELWRFGPAAFEVDGKPLGERAAAAVDMPKGSRVTISFDLAANLPKTGGFKLGCAGSGAKTDVATYEAVARGGVKFLDLSPEDLAKYKVLFVTNRGSLTMEMWPQHAPNHVRNFLDLANTGFYEGTLFHRVAADFMIQGGDPNTRLFPDDSRRWGSGEGPRSLKAEFNKEVHHVPGVLSAARTADPNSASSGFFIVTAPSLHLDGQYSAFGKAIYGMDTVMRIAHAPGTPLRAGGNQPTEPQRIEHTYVLLPD
jgi:peptidyl-prolyl cis-trans isomerase B (cyclophilin B)